MRHLKPLTTGAAAFVFLAGTATSAGAEDVPSVLANSTADSQSTADSVYPAATGDAAGRDAGSGATADSLMAVDVRDDAGRVVGELDLKGAHHEGPGDFRPGPWCNFQCITSGVAYLHGSGVRLVVETSVPAEIYMYGWRVDDLGDSLGTSGSPGLVSSFEREVPDLEPGGTYYAAVWATDEYGNSSFAEGTFTMLA